jgi:putative component of membrane protein insertase Oxa1/YidC/SpoIIIJ protein YidD
MISNLEILAIKAYQKISHPVYHLLEKAHINFFGCRYNPSCSNYTIEAITKYGAAKGTYLGLKRLSRCRPPYGGNDLLQ